VEKTVSSKNIPIYQLDSKLSLAADFTIADKLEKFA
jgi:hypothetical protein